MRKHWIFIAIVIFVSAVMGYNYVYKDHRNIEGEKAQYSITAQQIHSEFMDDLDVSQKKYLNKTIEISGTVSEMSQTEITLEDKVFCQFSQQITEEDIQLNSKITVKGRFIGFDDLLEQIKLEQCINN